MTEPILVDSELEVFGIWTAELCLVQNRHVLQCYAFAQATLICIQVFLRELFDK